MSSRDASFKMAGTFCHLGSGGPGHKDPHEFGGMVRRLYLSGPAGGAELRSLLAPPPEEMDAEGPPKHGGGGLFGGGGGLFGSG